MADNPRIDDLRKRLEKEPGSRLFAQLAEELRKAGELAEAIQVCRDGLEKHANYTSARMTLGRALMDTGDLAGARGEFEGVVKAAADNILASRLLGECLEGLGDLQGALARYKTTLALAPGDKQVLTRIDEVNVRLKGPAPAAAPPPVTTPQPALPTPADDARTLAGTPIVHEPAPIPLAAADESFELETPYGTHAMAAGLADSGAAPTAPAMEIDESFEIEPAYAAPPTVVETPAAAPVPPLAVSAEPVEEPAQELASSTLAELYFNQGHTEKAIKIYRQLVEREPGNGRVQARLTELLAIERHLKAEEPQAAMPVAAPAPPPPAALSPQADRRAAIERVIGRLERLREAVRRE